MRRIASTHTTQTMDEPTPSAEHQPSSIQKLNSPVRLSEQDTPLSSFVTASYETQRGKKGLVVNDARFTFKRSKKGGQRMIWACVTNRCPMTVETTDAFKIVSTKLEHSRGCSAGTQNLHDEYERQATEVLESDSSPTPPPPPPSPSPSPSP